MKVQKGAEVGKWKFNIGDQVLANEKAPGDYRCRKGTIVQRGPSRGEYTVNIDGEKTFLNSWWLDLVDKDQAGLERGRLKIERRLWQ